MFVIGLSPRHIRAYLQENTTKKQPLLLTVSTSLLFLLRVKKSNYCTILLLIDTQTHTYIYNLVEIMLVPRFLEDVGSDDNLQQEYATYATTSSIKSSSSSSNTFWGTSVNDINNSTTDFDSNLIPVEDVSVDAVVTSIYFNAFVCLCLLITYEGLRRFFPTVYSSKKKLDRMQVSKSGTNNGENTHSKHGTNGADHTDDSSTFLYNFKSFENQEHHSSIASLPDHTFMDWVGPVFGVPWKEVRQKAGLDGYFFLRFIRMNVRITAVSSFWFFLILVPIYFTGSNKEHHAGGWYHLSAANIPVQGWRIFAPVVFAYLFSAFVVFVIKQEYRHYLELRQDFLARGSSHVDPQHHYSLMVEAVPYELRSDRALKDYFSKLYPGKVHSASVVLKVPDLERESNRCERTCRRLEKAIAHLHATGERPTHVVGRGRFRMLGVELAPCDCGGGEDDVYYLDEDVRKERPSVGTRVDCISYYTQELAAHSRTLFLMQRKKNQIAMSGNASLRADNWFDKAVRQAAQVADAIMDESRLDNGLLSPSDSFQSTPGERPVMQRAELMTSRYGSFSPATLLPEYNSFPSPDKKTSLLEEDHENMSQMDRDGQAPFSRDQYKSRIRRWAGRLGLDFVVAVAKVLNKQLDVALEGVLSSTMSSTGFVTFLDLSSLTSAASVPLTMKSSVLNVSVAPEPREILWENAHVSGSFLRRRELITNVVLAIGVLLWSFPLAAIQAFAKAEYLAQLPGMGWMLTFHGGTLTNFVNGYLPVVALLTLVLILPVIFEFVARVYERRKTISDVQSSMLSRYFYYQLANIYVSVTAGSILKSLADIIDHPSNILQLLGESLPTMVGYFVALLVTKTMAGLPMVFLRFGALSRMLALKLLSNEKKLTQRELDSVYRQENVQYGWEFPTQLLVIVIVFTYATICPIILVVGAIYFVCALVVYKKQILYVYSPVYESGGAMFPRAVQHTLFGLACGQMTLLGYLTVRGCYGVPLLVLPLPILTIWIMGYFEKTFAIPGMKLSLERAREYDEMSDRRVAEDEGMTDSHGLGVRLRERTFDKSSYRQPVLTKLLAEPLPYRRGVQDKETDAICQQLHRINQFVKESQEMEALTVNPFEQK